MMEFAKVNSYSIKLNLGCGDQRLTNYIGLDRQRMMGTDLQCDLNHSLPLAAGTVSHIYAKSVLEHLQELETALKEMWRVLEPGGTVYIYVPHWGNPLYYSDYTHLRFFGLATFDYFSPSDKQIYRRVPRYSSVTFQTRQVRLIFHSPFRLLNGIMKLFQWLINKRVSWQLFFEYHLSKMIPCYAIEYYLEKV